MAQSDREPTPQFSQPVRQIVTMLIVLGLSGFGGFLALPKVLPIFEASPILNGIIATVFIVGVLATFWQVFQLFGSVRWIERFANGEISVENKPPQLLASLASLLRSRGTRMQLTSTSTQSILDSVATRIEEQRDITRYIVNLLIFLGLLGTFFGLATTVPAVVDTIRSLAPQEGDGGIDVFNRLMTGLESQLGGMGVAFGSSLLGLAGSLVVGLLELFAGHGQNRFYRELEDWLTSITRLGFASGEEGGASADLVTGLIEHMADQMEGLREVFAENDASRARVDAGLQDLVSTIAQMNDRQAKTEPLVAALDRVAEGQAELVALIREFGPGEGIDAESRMRLRSIDVQMLRVLEELSAGRQESMAEFRREMDMLARALSKGRATRGPGSDSPGSV
ncbi:biopolymer transporter ExbB [Chachezhania sediminis]|uniref:biopolymer transporter ExbB n=1 Tax=Chachezhania sediminis TaxID=2599291 RepID=UPI00131E39D8|nr:biopolymer transporter ExbB [Chachezhania sediminis]